MKKALKILVIGAHPDDNTLLTGGTTLLFTRMGHKVKYISTTNGDAGHHRLSKEETAAIRRKEAMEAKERLGLEEYTVLENHDGQLLPTLEMRECLIREIRKWQADLIMAPRPYDYHPDHRYTGQLVQDAAFLVRVPAIVLDTPALEHDPVFLYTRDHFSKPYPFSPDITVDITEVYDKKVYALDAFVSQMYEWVPWIKGYAEEVPADRENRLKWLAKKRKQTLTPAMMDSLARWYGPEKASVIIHAEAFEICEYGKIPSEKEIRSLFPMLPERKNV